MRLSARAEVGSGRSGSGVLQTKLQSLTAMAARKPLCPAEKKTVYSYLIYPYPPQTTLERGRQNGLPAIKAEFAQTWGGWMIAARVSTADGDGHNRGGPLKKVLHFPSCSYRVWTLITPLG